MDLPPGERRIHRVFTTWNTEYHLRRDVCVAVRDRDSGRFRDRHAALFQRLVGSVTRPKHGGCGFDVVWPSEGFSMLFSDGLMTTPVVSVHRTPQDVVHAYPVCPEGLGASAGHPVPLLTGRALET